MSKHARAYKSEKRKKEVMRQKKQEEKRVKRNKKLAEEMGVDLQESATTEPATQESVAQEPAAIDSTIK